MEAAPSISRATPETFGDKEQRGSMEAASSISRDGAAVLMARGYAEVRVRPDAVRARVAFEAEGDSVDRARNDALEKSRQVVASVKALGIAGLSIKPQPVTITPVKATPTYDDPEAVKSTSYRAAGSVVVTITGLAPDELADEGASVADAATTGGGGAKTELELFVVDPSEVRARALRAAVRSAQQDAKAMAEAAGVHLLQLRSLETSPTPSAATTIRVPSGLSDASAPAAGDEITIATSVVARYGFAR